MEHGDSHSDKHGDSLKHVDAPHGDVAHVDTHMNIAHADGWKHEDCHEDHVDSVQAKRG